MKRDSTDSKEDELLTMMEEIQEENEKIQEENMELRGENKSLRIQASEAQQMISQLSSENSILRNELQKKCETIVSLNAQIGKLSESDLVLKQNEQLERQNRELRASEQRARQEAAAMVLTAKKEAAETIKRTKSDYEIRESDLKHRETEISDRETAVADRENTLQTEVKEQAQQIVQKKLHALTADFRRRRRGYSGFVTITLIYSVFLTLITVYRSERFLVDTVAFIEISARIFLTICNLADSAGQYAGALGELIPYPLVAAIACKILYLLVSVLSAGVALVIPLLIVFVYIRFIQRNQADELSVFAAVIDLACVLFMADEIKQACSINLLFLMMLIFLFYSVIRGIIELE